MPTVLRTGPYRFYFFAGDGAEPPHIHVERNDGEAKFWLVPVRLEYSYGFRAKEIRDIERLVTANLDLLMESWREFFNH